MVLRVEGCSVGIGGAQILHDVSLEAGRGEILALVGHNGAGKSTLIKTMIGMRDKQSGSMAIHQENIDDHLKGYKRMFSYIPEEPLLFSELTTLQHFELYKQSYSIDRETFASRVERYMNAFEITDKKDEYPEALSKGMRQKVQTICALLPVVPVLFIDEPFMGLDVYAGKFLEEELNRKKEEGMTIVLTTHQLDKVKTLADTYIMLKNGSVSSRGPVESFEMLVRRKDQ